MRRFPIFDAFFKMAADADGVEVNFIVEGHVVAHLKGILVWNANMKEKIQK